jgi:hypothetical protein
MSKKKSPKARLQGNCANRMHQSLLVSSPIASAQLCSVGGALRVLYWSCYLTTAPEASSSTGMTWFHDQHQRLDQYESDQPS